VKTRRCTFRSERWTLREPFVIANLVQADAEFVVVEVVSRGLRGRGECERDDRLMPGCANVPTEIERTIPAIERGATRDDLLELLPAGPARSALDCALWDLEAKERGEPVWAIAGLPEPRPVTTAYTLRAAPAARMAEDAARNADRPLLKLKLDGERTIACIEAVRAAAPSSTLIADANGSLSTESLPDVIAACARHDVRMLEQPLPRDHDRVLGALSRTIPICADESFHDRRTLSAVIGHYDMVNIKLDKTGGLTEALQAIAEAKSHGLRIMIGCMLGTSLAMAPAFLLAPLAEHVDLDGPLMLGDDRPGGMRYERSTMHAADRAFWG
jgi:L-alanine-DL-glutamate epimerase-like enolase superfamily enzyme